MTPRDVTIDRLNFSYGDREDWFVLKTPQALKAFSSAKAAQILKSMLRLEFTDAETRLATSPIRQQLSHYGYDHDSGDGGREQDGGGKGVAERFGTQTRATVTRAESSTAMSQSSMEFNRAS